MKDSCLQNLNLTVTDGGHFTPDEKTEWSLPAHRATFNKFYYVTRGACLITIDGVPYVGKAGALFFIPAGALHSYRIAERPFEKYWMHLDLSPEGGLFRFEKTPYLVYPKGKATEAAFRRFRKAFTGTGIADLLTVRAAAYDLLAAFARASLPEGGILPAPQGPLGDVLRVMERDLSNSPSNEELAAVCHMHPTYFIRYFKAEIGYTPQVYLSKLRMARACALLRENRLSVSEIAAQLGFYDGMYFSKVFKRHYSMTPTEYRRLYGK